MEYEIYDPNNGESDPSVTSEITEDVSGGGEIGDEVITDTVTGTTTNGYQESIVDKQGGGSRDSRDKNISTKKLYNTISCPCSSYAVIDSNGGIACEKLDFGVKLGVKSMVIKNHYIDSKIPRVGDKWKCLKDCQQGNFKWNTYHVVSVEENNSEISSSLVNSMSSTSRCYIPPTTLKDYKGNTVDERIKGISSPEFQDIINTAGLPKLKSDLSNPITYIDGKPLYESVGDIYYYTALVDGSGGKGKYTYYKDDKYEGYLPGIVFDHQHYISSVSVNGEDILGKHFMINQVGDIDCLSDTIFNYSAEEGKLTIDSTGGNIKVLIKGGGEPVFTLSIEDSSNCSILNSSDLGVKLNGIFELNQAIPPLPKGSSQEVYTLKITPGANLQYYYGGSFHRALGNIKMKIYQFARGTVTLSAATSTISNITQTSSNSTFIGEINKKENTSTTHTINVKQSSGSDNYYIKDKVPPIEDVISYDTVIKKKVIKDEGDGRVIDAVNEITVVNAFTSDGTTVTNTGDVEKGMQFDFAVEKTKTARKSIDLDIHKEPCDDCDDELDILTNRFELENTNDLFKEMYVEGVDYLGIPFTTIIKSIDCSKTITLEDEYILNKNTELKFKYSNRGIVMCSTRSGKGEKVTLSKAIIIPRNTTINFENPTKPKLKGHIKYDRSGDNGVNGITVSTVIKKIKFGQVNTTITIDTDSLITNKPNACNQYLTIVRDNDLYIDFSRCDIDTNRYSKTVTITKQPNSGVLNTVAAVGKANVTYMKKYTPTPNFKGKDTVRYTTSDGVNSSDEKTIYITVK
jgi:hypothetical protein